MKRYWLKNRVLVWIIAMIIWGILAVAIIIIALLDSEKLAGSVCVLLAWGMLISFVVLLFAGKVKIIDPVMRIRLKIELFNDGIVLDEIFDSLSRISPETEEMLSKIQAMLDKDKMIENAKQQARYLALQNQINPHFLYNVLESMRSDAIMAGVPEIGKIAEALAVFFRYTTSQMENLSTLQEELGNVENYFMIQKYRFEEKIELQIKYPSESEEVLKSVIPKLTLQPIVENAIKHGLEPKVEGGKVVIDIEHSERNLYLSINDDGVGIDEDKLEYLNEKLVRLDNGDGSMNESGKGGIALINVNSRIRLLMGEEYGVHIFSTPGIGTEVRLTLPYMFEKEKEEHR